MSNKEAAKRVDTVMLGTQRNLQKMAADIRLTKAVILIGEARELLADYAGGVK